jgi:hypothetical protein
MSASSGLRALPVALAAAICLLPLVAAPAGAATDVEDSYALTLAPGGTTTDQLRIAVPDDLDDPDLAWRVQVVGGAGPGCGDFALTLLDDTGAQTLVLTGARADGDGHLEVGVRVLAADDQGRPTPLGSHRCDLRLRTGDFAQVVEVTLLVEGAAPNSSTTTSTTTSTTLPATTTTAAPTATTEEDTTTSSSTTTSTLVVAPAGATGGGEGGGGLPSGGPGPLVGATVVAGFGLLLLGGGLVATSGRPPPGRPRRAGSRADRLA